MKLACTFAAVALLACVSDSLHAARGGGRSPKRSEIYLLEDDLAYARCLDLAPDGTYRQINRDMHNSEEVDQGTWESNEDGTLHLRATRGALRFHALVAGPLSVALRSQSRREALPALRDVITAFLASSADEVFSAKAVAGINAPKNNEESRLGLDFARASETCSRLDLQALIQQINDFISTEASGVYVLTPLRIVGGSPVYTLADDTFQAVDLARVQRDYRTAPGGLPPFYFASVNKEIFMQTVGSWRVPILPGSPE